jgi:predicted transcriptional regulator of viral defense system
MNVNFLGDWVESLQQRGIYTFLRQDALAASGLSADAVNKSLQRLAKRRRIAKVTDSFFVVIPTEYMNAGSPPASWFIHALMEARQQPYYVGLLSAASLHGASHHQPQEFQVVTSAAVRPINVARQRLHFFTRRFMETTPVIDIKTPTGMIHVSTPAATVLDLVRFSNVAGHLDNVATVINDLAEKLTPEAMLETARHYGEIPTIQRLGYLLELVGAKAVAGPLAKWLATQHSRAVPLRPGRPIASAMPNFRWRILANQAVEVES